VTFTNGTTVIGSASLDSSGVATLTPNLQTGSYAIVAAYSGDALHGSSTSQPVTITNPATGFILAVTPATVALKTTQNTTVAITLTSVGSFADTIGLGCASLPSGVNCHFATITSVLAAGATQTVQLTIDTNSPLTGGLSAMNGHAGSLRVSLAGIFLPAGLFLGLVVWRFRKRHVAILTGLLVLVASCGTLLLAGCSGLTQSNAAPGTYVIQVVGVGANSNISRYENVTLNITQ
jgi:hypothetical protein